jgi:chorismate mutase
MISDIKINEIRYAWFEGHEDLFSKLRTGDVFLEKTKFNNKRPMSWLSFAVRKIGGIEYNHAREIINENGQIYAVEAVNPVVRKTPWIDIIHDPEIEKVLILRAKDYDKINQAKYIYEAKALIGLPYDKPALLFHQLVQQLSKRLKLSIWIGRIKKKAMGMWYCFEIVAYLRRDIFKRFWRIDPETEFIPNPIWDVYFDSRKI